MQFSELPDLHDANFGLRPIRTNDLQAWYAYLSLPQVYQHTSWDLRSVDDLSHYACQEAAPTPDSMLRLAVVRSSDDILIGTAGFHTVSSLNRSAEITYDLHPDYWGQGIASKLCKTLTAWAHHAVKLNRVQATVLVSNQRSEQVLLRNGFQYEGLLRSFRMVRGQPGDFKMYAHLLDQ